MDKKLYTDLKEQFREITLIDIDDYDLLFSNRIDRLEETAHISVSDTSLRQDLNKQKEEMVFMFNNILSTKVNKNSTYRLLQFDDIIIIKFICESQEGSFYINEYILKKIDRKEKFKELTGIDLDNYEIGESEQMSYNGVMSYHSLEYIVDFVIDGGEFNILKQENPITGIPNYILTMRYVNDNNKPTIVSYLLEFNTESFTNETTIDLNKYELDSIISYEKGESKFSYDEPQDTTLEELIKNFNNKKYTNIRISYSVNDKQYTLSLKNIDNNEYYTYTFKHK